MKTFIKKQQEEVLAKLTNTSEYINDTLWYVNPQDLDPLISQVVQNTVEEASRRVGNIPQEIKNLLRGRQ